MVSSGQFGNQEDTCQRSVHDAGHESRHTYQSEVRLRHHQSAHIHDSRREKTGDSSHEERRREDTSYTSGTVGSHRSDNLEQDDKTEIGQQHPMPVACRPFVMLQGAVLDCRHRVPVDELADHIVSFSVQRREDINQDAQRHASDKQFRPHAPDSVFEPLLQFVHASCEIETDKSAHGT